MNGDGDITRDETFDGDDSEFEEIDINKDGVIDKTRATVAICTCENELYITLEQISTGDMGEYSIEFLSGIAWKNEFDFFEMDSNNDMMIDYGKLKITLKIAWTTMTRWTEMGMAPLTTKMRSQMTLKTLTLMETVLEIMLISLQASIMTLFGYLQVF